MTKRVSLHWAVLLILLYAVIGIVLLLHHEPWEDEAQAWLIARDLDIISIFKQMAYEGTPALWYILLVPFAKAGLPYTSEFILHLTIAIAAVSIFVLYAPFSKITKVLFIFSYYMAYEYSIIARSYCLSILLLFLIATLYGKRFDHPLWYALLVFLLFNTNAHSVFIASSLTILFAWESYREKAAAVLAKPSIFIMVMGGVLSFLQLLPRSDSIDYNSIIGSVYLAPFIATANAFFPWHPLVAHGEQRLILIVIAISILFTIILSQYKKPEVLFILLLSLSGLFYIFVFVYTGAMRHHGFILIISLFALWISTGYHDSHKKLPRTAFKPSLSKISVFKPSFSNISLAAISICLVLSLPYSFRTQRKEYKYIFSGAKEMAHFIKGHDLNNCTIVAHPSPYASALLPYLPGEKFWYADIEDYGTIVHYNKKYVEGCRISNTEVISRMKDNFPQKSQILLLLSTPLKLPESNSFTLLYKVEEAFGYNNEKYYLYKFTQEEL